MYKQGWKQVGSLHSARSGRVPHLGAQTSRRPVTSNLQLSQRPHLNSPAPADRALLRLGLGAAFFNQLALGTLFSPRLDCCNSRLGTVPWASPSALNRPLVTKSLHDTPGTAQQRLGHRAPGAGSKSPRRVPAAVGQQQRQAGAAGGKVILGRRCRCKAP